MQLFFRRPAASVLAVFIASSVVGFYINTSAKLAAAVVITVAAICMGVLLILRRLRTALLRRIFAMSVAAVIALTSSYLYFDVKYTALQRYVGKECRVEGVVIARRYSNSFSDGYTVAIQSIDGEEAHFDAILDCEYTSDLQPGYAFNATVIGERLGYSGYDSSDKRTELSDGFLLRFVSEDADACLITDENVSSFRLTVSSLNRSLSVRLRRLVGGEEGNLTAALVLGDRSNLSDSTVRDFRRAGASHLLALSGLHMAIIMGIFEFVLKKLTVTKPIRLVILIGMLSFYLALTGFSISASRAAIMLTLVYISFFLARSADGVTSLFIAGGVILLVSPAAVADVGFWLSFLATLGILVCVPVAEALFERLYVNPNGTRREILKNKFYKMLIKILIGVATALCATFAANTATAFIVWAAFGEISTATLLTNLILSPLTAVLLFCGIIMVLTLWSPALSAVFTTGAKAIAGLMLNICEAFSKTQGTVVSLRYGFAGVIIVLLAIAVGVMLIVKLRHKWTIFIPTAVAIVAFVICLGAYNNIHADEIKVSYLHNGKSEMLVASHNGQALICDISDGGYSNICMALAESDNQNSTEISVFVLTHYHKKHISSVYRLICSELVHQIWLPRPTNDNDYNVMCSIVDYAERCGCETIIYDPDSELTIFGEASMRVVNSRIKRSTHPVISVIISNGGDDICYIGASLVESELYETVCERTKYSENLIFGIHGPIIKSTYSFPVYGGLDTVTFSDATVMSYLRYDDIPQSALSLAQMSYAPECRRFTLKAN